MEDNKSLSFVGLDVSVYLAARDLYQTNRVECSAWFAIVEWLIFVFDFLSFLACPWNLTTTFISQLTFYSVALHFVAVIFFFFFFHKSFLYLSTIAVHSNRNIYLIRQMFSRWSQRFLFSDPYLKKETLFLMLFFCWFF